MQFLYYLTTCLQFHFNLRFNCTNTYIRSSMYHTFLLWTLYIIIQTHTSLLQYVKPEAAITIFDLLMMGSVSPETC